MSTTPPEPLTLEQRIKELKKQLKDEKLKSALCEKAIDIMRDEHWVTVKSVPAIYLW